MRGAESKDREQDASIAKWTTPYSGVSLTCNNGSIVHLYHPYSHPRSSAERDNNIAEMEDKYIGLALALGGTFLIGSVLLLQPGKGAVLTPHRSSFIITKKASRLRSFVLMLCTSRARHRGLKRMELTEVGTDRRCESFTRQLPLSPTAKLGQECLYVDSLYRRLGLRKRVFGGTVR